MLKIFARLAAVAAFALLPLSAAQAGKIVVNHDEWTLSNSGFSNAGAANTGTFAANVASFFTGGGAGNFLAYSNNFGLVQSQLASAMTGAGHSWTVSTGVAFDLATLMTYDAVFVGGQVGGGYPNNSVLIDYVNAGGNVYLMGGTGNGGAAAEAAGWNPFLNAFGFEFASNYNGIGGVQAATGPDYAHPIFGGVAQLYGNNGNSLSLTGGSPYAALYGGVRFGVYDDGGIHPVPAPAALGLFGLGLIGLTGLRRRK